MIDTLKLLSTSLTKYQCEKIFNCLELREGKDIKTGELIYRITSKMLEGSYDNRISCRLQQDPLEQTWHLLVEGSVHKAVLGHNIFGYYKDYFEAVKDFQSVLEKIFDLEFTDIEDWRLLRVDFSQAFYFDDLERITGYERISEFFRGINNVYFPRRKVHKYDCSGIFFPGTTTAVKFYHKGAEFWKNSYRKARKFFGEAKAQGLLQIANNILRVEVSIKQKKLEYDFQKKIVKVSDISQEYLEKLYEVEVKKVMKEGEKMEIVRSASDVERRLYAVYTPKLAGLLLGTWSRLSLLGEENLRQKMNRITLWRQKNQLKEAGISWTGTDILLKEFQVIPVDFIPLKSDKRCLTMDVEKELGIAV